MSQDKQQVSSSAATIKSKSQQNSTTTTQTSKASKRKEDKRQQEARLPSEATNHNNKETQQISSREMRTQTKLVANLHSAANDGKVELVRLLLRCGADVNAQDEQFGNTALHQAAWNGFSETVQVLCKCRANTSIRNKAQFTPLHLACQQGHNQTARLLLMANAKTEAKNSYGDTPLHTAARYGHAGVARILLSAKSNLNQVNKNNDTPLHIAAAMGRRKITKILMQNGAEPAIKNKQGETAMDIALRKDLIDIQELIANPPPAARKHSQAAAAELSQLERRFGQLYSTTNGQLSAANFQQKPTTNSDTRRLRRAKGHRNRASNSSNDHSSGQNRKWRPPNSARAPQLASGEFELAVDVPDELLRANSNGRIARKGLSVSVAALSAQQGSSAAKLPSGPTKLSSRKSNNLRTRTLAGGSGADLHLLPSLVERRRTLQLEASSSQAAALAAAVEAAKRTAGEACAPDSRDNPSEWAAIMAESANYRSANSPPVIAFEDADDREGATRTTTTRISAAPRIRRPQTSGGKRSSPAGSFRSTLSKSRGRNLVVACGNRKQQLGATIGRRPALLVRRPKLGSCVGKLRLLRLRTMVGKRASKAEEDGDGEEGEGEGEAASAAAEGDQSEQNANDDGSDDKQKAERNDDKRATRDAGEKAADKSGDLSAEQKPATAAAALGRRHERLQRTSAQLEGKRAALAPNGSQLLATRPLAALSDDTQLYAIPKKSKAKQEQQQQVADKNEQEQQPAKNSNEQANSAKNGKRTPSLITTMKLKLSAASDESAARTPSAGPALTSDGGHSSCSAGSSNSARQSPSLEEPSRSSSPIASSSDECIDLVRGGQQKSQTRQTSRLELRGNICSNSPEGRANNNCKRPAVVGVHELGEGDLCAPAYSVIGARPEPCLCQPTYGQQQPEVSAPSFKSAHQGSQQQQVAASGKQASNAAESSGGQTRTSKLRQLLHLESRNKDTNGGSSSDSNAKQERVSSQTQKPIVVRTMQSAAADNSVDSGKGKGTTTVTVVAAKDYLAGKSATTAVAAAAALIGDRQAPPMSAIAGGYYAYSPVVQSSSELRGSSSFVMSLESGQQAATTATSSPTNTKSGTKKSWLMSKFSLSSNSIQHANVNSNSTTTNSANTSPSQAPISQQTKLSPVRIELSATNGAMLAAPAETGSSVAPSLAGEQQAADLHAGSRLLLGPERKAELITISGQELHKIAASTANRTGPFHWSTGAPLPTMARDELSFHQAQLRLHQQQQQLQQQLIRPKSALSATSASLIAAQKSLAAAAAAKVRRDRMFKLGAGARDECCVAYDHDDDDDDHDDDDGVMEKPSHQFVASSKESVLTVKTSESPFWSHHHHQPLVVATAVHNSTAGDHLGAGPKYLMTNGGHNSHHHRSGTNSVGMSDSSPSNNGAESDNSLQTTTGSMNTDNTSAVNISANNNNITRIEQQQQHQSSPTPLGILSRILLNNKGFASSRQKQLQQQPDSKQKHRISSNDDDDEDDEELTVTAADSSSSTLRGSTKQQQPLHLRNGSLSPNCSPSTLSSSASNQSPQMVSSGSQQQIGLDQLHSRSRCPIVLSKSNELQATSTDDDHKKTIANKCAEREEHESTAKVTVLSSHPQTPPKLPSKSALKTVAAASSQRLANGHGEHLNCLGGDNSVSQILVESSMNGLPRVSSYTHISSSSSSANSNSSQLKQVNQLQVNDSRAAALCNYHAMNTQQPASHSTHYGLYSPYGYQQNAGSRYSYHAQQQEQAVYNQAMRPIHHLSHHDLSRPATSGPHHHHHLSHQQVDGQVDLTLPATAVNYEYYLEAGTPTSAVATAPTTPGPAHYHHPHLSQPARFHYATNANDSIIYPAPNYQQDYSIYIPYASSQPSARNSSSSGATTTNTTTAHHQLA